MAKQVNLKDLPEPPAPPLGLSEEGRKKGLFSRIFKKDEFEDLNLEPILGPEPTKDEKKDLEIIEKRRKQDFKDLTAQQNELKETRERISSSIDSLKKNMEIEHIKELLRHKEEVLDQKEKHLEDIKISIAKKEKEILSANVEISKNQKDFTKILKKHEIVEKKHAHVKEAAKVIEERESKLRDWEKRLVAERRDVNDIRLKLASEEESVTKKIQHLQKLMENVHKEEYRNKTLAARLNNMDKKYEQLLEEEKKIRRMKEDFRKLKEELQIREDAIRMTERNIAENKQKLDYEQGSIVGEVHKLELLKKQISVKEAFVKSKSKEIEELDSKLKSVERREKAL